MLPFSFFLCYEDILNEPAEVDGASQGSSMVRMWSIGQWVQVKPDPNTEDIYDWYADFRLFNDSSVYVMYKLLLK